MLLRHKLYCNYTGVEIGVLDLSMSAGHIPYLSHWNDMVCHHALFSLTQRELWTFLTNEWNRLSKDIVNEQASDSETLSLRIGFVALLHSMGSIRRDRGSVGLPSTEIVQSNLAKALDLVVWQNFLDSRRFSFPELHISTLNDNANLQTIQDYLQACEARREEYEKGIDEAQELERSKIAEKAILAVRNNMYKPTSRKLLWTYCKGYLGGKWAADAAGWMRSIFLAGTSSITDWDFDEIELMEEIIFSNIPAGTSIRFAIRERVNELKAQWHDHYDAFTLEEDTISMVEELKQELAEEPEPQEKNYPNKAAFFVARAKWQLAHPVNYTQPHAATEAARSKL